MKKTIIIILGIIILAVIAEVVYLFATRWDSGTEPQEQQALSVIELERIPSGQNYEYNIDSAKFIIYAPYFEAYNNGELIYKSKPLYMVSDLFAFQTNDGKYIIVNNYSGGAHCCSEGYVFFLSNGELKLIKKLFTGNASISKESLMSKDDNVYIKVFDDRFAYFYAPFAGSYFFPQHLKVNKENIETDNSIFKQDYLEEAQECEKEINQAATDNLSGFESYSPMLVCVAVSYSLAGQEETAWDKVESYFNIIPLDLNGEDVDFETFRQEFTVLYQKEAFVGFDDSEEKQDVNLFYYNPQKDEDEDGNIMCSRQGLVSVQREVSSTDIIKNTIDELLKGNLTSEERAKGITTEYPLSGFSLLGYNLEDGVLTLTFEDSNSQAVGGSCRVGILWFQIETTARQFPGVNSVRFLPEEIFQP